MKSGSCSRKFQLSSCKEENGIILCASLNTDTIMKFYREYAWKKYKYCKVFSTFSFLSLMRSKPRMNKKININYINKFHQISRALQRPLGNSVTFQGLYLGKSIFLEDEIQEFFKIVGDIWQ